MSACFYCKGTDRETRPYGPGGSSVCFPCATSSPEREEAAKDMFIGQLNAAEELGGAILIGEDTGPRPILNPKPLQ